MKRVITLFLCILCSTFLYAQLNKNDEIVIIDKPINYDSTRIKLSLDYLKTRHGLLQDKPIIEPTIIVLHYTDFGTLESIFNYFNNTEIENSRSLIKSQSLLNVSAHFLVDRDGKIYRLMQETLFARHTIGLNYCAIGIENIGSAKNPLTKEQVIANIKLVKYLCGKYKIEYLIGHSEYLSFQKSSLWKETNPDYFTYKSDPGDDFMKEVRSGLENYNLKYKP